MKIQISINGEVVPGGVYSSVKPIGTCVEKLKRLFSVISEFAPQDESKIHCTVLYSRNKDNAQGFLKGKPVYVARIKEFTSWIGHDELPYLVMLLDSPELTDAFTQWRDLGYSTDFPEYQPHITVAKGLDVADIAVCLNRLNEKLKTDLPFVLTFGAQAVEPLRD